MVLSEEQRAIVNATENRIAVIGPPGTGKTRVLTERIKRLLESGVKPQDIVAITFTNVAANEMKSRLPNSDGMFIGTMHSLALHILMSNGITVNIDEMVQKSDFSKLIHAVNDNPLLKKPAAKYLFVDEVQDLCQYEFTFINDLIYDNLFLCGDVDQCIYQFKGANPTLFNSYCKDRNTKLYILTHNFRCGQNIINFADYFVEDIREIDFQVEGNLQKRGWVQRTDFDDALFELYNAKSYGNWFILTRTNSELAEISNKLESFNIPYTSFKQGDLTNEEIKELLQNDKVKLLTIHSAKGLETDNVIVVGARTWSNEERCIAYVAATRARSMVYWCPSVATPKMRKSYNTKTKRPVIKWD